MVANEKKDHQQQIQAFEATGGNPDAKDRNGCKNKQGYNCKITWIEARNKHIKREQDQYATDKVYKEPIVS